MNKRASLFFTIFLCCMLTGCAGINQEVVPTSTVIPTNTTEPTLVPTEALPTTEPTIEPTETVEPTATLVPTATDIPEPTVVATSTPTPPSTPSPTPTPTPIPHEHVWAEKSIQATCALEGKTWEECECGAVRNEVFFEKTAHEKTTYKVVTEATTEEDGAYEMVCDACGAVVESGKINIIETVTTPTPLPTNTPTPVPTSTPTPLPTSTPTPVPTEAPEEKCSHPVWTVSFVEENEAEEIYQESCEDCGEVFRTFAVPKATATPTPKPTKKPEPTKAPKPTETPAEVTDNPVVRNYYTDYGSHFIEYADGTIEEYCEYEDYLPKDAKVISYKVTSETKYVELNGRNVKVYPTVCKELILYFEKEMYWTKERLSYYMYYYYDGETKEYTCRLVNSDGSYNKLSDLVIGGFHSGISMQGKEVWEGNKKVGYEVTFIDFQSGYDDPRIIYAEDFIYHEDGVIRLYEY